MLLNNKKKGRDINGVFVRISVILEMLSNRDQGQDNFHGGYMRKYEIMSP